MIEFVDKSRMPHFKINSPYGYDVKMWHPLNYQQVWLIHQKSIQSEHGQELYTSGTHLRKLLETLD